MSFPSFVRSSAKFSSSPLRNPAALGIAFLVAAACPRAGAQSTTPPVTYTITDLGILPGGYETVGQQYSAPCGGSYGDAINASGDVTGYSYTQAELTHAVIFRGGKVIDLGVVPGANSSVGNGINGYDQVTGAVSSPSSSHVFLYSAGKMTDLGTAPGYDSSFGDTINDSAQIAGGSENSGSYPAFLYSAGKFTNIPDHFNLDANGDYIQETCGIFPYGSGNVINASGQIAGGIYGKGGGAAIYSNGSVSLLDIPPAYAPDMANGINDTAQVTGYVYSPSGDGETAAFLYSPGKPYPESTAVIPKLPNDFYSFGTGVNAAGQVVGLSYNPQINSSDPFLYTPNQGAINVNSLLAAGSGWTLTDAEAINDKGQITGAGINPQGYLHAYLLSPAFTQFSTLNAAVDLIGKPANTFAAGGRFTLGAASHGINPLTETTVLQLGGYHISIPPASFTQTNGVYFYKGKIGNVNLQAVIRPVAENVFLFGVVGQGAVGLPPSYPLNLVLTVGTDTGFQQIDTNYNAGNLTEAQVCAAFGLTCN